MQTERMLGPGTGALWRWSNLVLCPSFPVAGIKALLEQLKEKRVGGVVLVCFIFFLTAKGEVTVKGCCSSILFVI